MNKSIAILADPILSNDQLGSIYGLFDILSKLKVKINLD